MRKLSKRQFVKLSEDRQKKYLEKRDVPRNAFEDTRDRWRHMNQQIEPLEKGTRSISFAQFMKDKCQKLAEDPESLFHNDEFINLLGERRQTDWAKGVITRSRTTLHIPSDITLDSEARLISTITTDRLLEHYHPEKNEFNIAIKTGKFMTDRFDSHMYKISDIGVFTVPREIISEINVEDKEKVWVLFYDIK